MSQAKTLRRAQEVLALRDPRSLQSHIQHLGRGIHSSRRDRLTAWVYGAIRRRRTLGVVLGAVAKRAIKKRKPEVIAALELLAWRLLFADESPEVLSSDVAALLPGKKDRAHVTRVLELLVEAVAERLGAADGGDSVLPVSREAAVRFTTPLLGVSSRNLAGRLGILHSHPDALVESWIAAHGPERAPEICRAANDPPPLFARCNPLRATVAELVAALAADGVTAEPCDTEGAPYALRLTAGRGRFRDSAAWREGKFSIQDLTAQRAALFVNPAPGEVVLDLCAAPGGKTMAMAELAGDQGRVIACDYKQARLRRVEENARRLGLTSIEVHVLDARQSDRAHELVLELVGDDVAAILVDAPCSNTGVLRRRPEARWRYDRRSQRRLVRQQEQILGTALGLLRPGARLVYSVCSIEPEEGSQLIASIVEAQPGLTLEAEELFLPEQTGGDGGYLARLRRS